MRIFRMILECATPLHCGCASDDFFLDQPVNRDAFGIWRIPGSSLAGALRALGQRLDEKMTVQLFGRQEKEQSCPSLVWCEDGLLLDFDGMTAAGKKLAGKNIAIPLRPFVRDHVRLDLRKDSAVAGGKFDEEIVPTGARFFLEFRCDGWNRPLTREEKDFFDQLCALVLDGRLELGGKSSNGYGRYRVLESSRREIDLLSEKGMEAWLNLEPGRMFAKNEGEEIPLRPAKSGPPASGLNGRLRIPLACAGPILIGGGQASDENGLPDVDMLFALSPWLDYEHKKLFWRWLVPGSSMKGVLRHAVFRILQDLGLKAEKAEEVLENLFGRIEESGGQCGKLLVEDCLLACEGEWLPVQHVAIDRFTGGAAAGALFDEAPLWREGLEMSQALEIRNAGAAEAFLFFHALLDLADGLLSVGNGCNRGNGRLKMKGLAEIRGDLSWDDRPLLREGASLDMSALKELAKDWDLALRKEVRDESGI